MGAGCTAPFRETFRKRKPWVKEEDAKLLILVTQYGTNRTWPTIGAEMGTRTGKQCWERYHNHLKSGAKELKAIKADTNTTRLRIPKKRVEWQLQDSASSILDGERPFLDYGESMEETVASPLSSTESSSVASESSFSNSDDSVLDYNFTVDIGLGSFEGDFVITLNDLKRTDSFECEFAIIMNDLKRTETPCASPGHF
jgi:hypothetical protein